MKIRLYLIHNSHPCDAVARALELKGLPFSVTEWPPTLHVLTQRVLFGDRTVPGITIDGEKILGSSRIFHRLDELVPEPALYPEPHRAAVEAADRWGNEEFQQVARDLIWAAAKHRPDALASYTRGSRIPLPARVVTLSAPAIIAAEQRLNRTDDAKAARRLADLPAMVAKVDAWIAQGIMGDPEHPNAADLQILSSVRLMNSIGDVAPFFADSRAPGLAERLFGGPVGGHLPVGALSAA